jgi:hypothetical protein
MHCFLNGARCFVLLSRFKSYIRNTTLEPSIGYILGYKVVLRILKNLGLIFHSTDLTLGQ